MAMRVHVAVSAIFFVTLSLLMLVGPRGRAAADAACIDQPDREAPFGEHWYYHFDRERNRKCWHRGAVAILHQFSLPAPLRMERSRSFSSSLNAAWSQTTRNFRNFFRQPMFHEHTAGEPHIIQNDAGKTLTIDDIVTQQPELFPEERPEPRLPPSLTLTQQKTLYDEFLKWAESQQRTAGGNGRVMPAAER
jgi:hypothetical protein